MKKSKQISVIIFSILGLFTIMSLIGNYNVTVISTSIKDVIKKNEDKGINVVFLNENGSDQVLVESDNVVSFENIVIDDTTVFDYEVTFNNISSKINYVFYIENKSDIDAVLQDYELPNPVCIGFFEDCEKYLQGMTYKIMFESGNTLTAGDVINAHSKRKVILSLEYKANKNYLPSSTVDITNLGFDLAFKER